MTSLLRPGGSLHRIALVSLLATACASGLNAAAVTTAAGVVEGIWTDQFFTGHSPFTSSYGFNSNIGASNSVVPSGSTSAGNTYLSSSFSGSASSAATVGILHVAASGTLTNQPANHGASTFQVKSVAHFLDSLTVMAPGAGATGFMSLDITVNGVNTWTSNAFANTYLDVKIGTNSYETLGVNFGNGVNGSTTVTSSLKPIAFGNVTIIIDLYTIVSVCVPCTGTLGSPIQASSDFSHTAQLTGAALQNASHEVVAATITGDPGYNYSTFTAVDAVPEPASLTLVPIGIAGILLALKRRRGRSICRT